MTKTIRLVSPKTVAVLVCALLSIFAISTVYAQSTTTVMNAQASTSQPQVGRNLTVTLTISNVQNLAGIDTSLTWNAAVLSLTNSVLNLGDSHTNGVLHGSKLNYDQNNLASGDIYVSETKVSGSYELVAQSVGASNPGFTGSGTIVTLTFKVLTTGSAGLSLDTDLADHPASGQTANLIDHQDTADSVIAIAASASSTPQVTSSPSSSPSNTPSITPVQSNTPSPSVPEFPVITLAAVFIALATVGLLLTTKRKHAQ
jgi:hypothetical protein